MESSAKRDRAKNSWSDIEISAIVEDYFSMLSKELRGEAYVKAAHRATLYPKLNSRSAGSIERKHQNISAILHGMGLAFVDGYKPLGNYQKQLGTAVRGYIQKRDPFEDVFEPPSNKYLLACKAWPLLVQAAKAKKLVYYGDLCRRLFGKPTNAVRWALDPIQSFCLEKGLPPLTSLVVREKGGQAGIGFTAWHGDLKDAQEKVYAHAWDQIPPPFTLQFIKRYSEAVGGEIDPSSYDVPDQQAVVNGRGGYQDTFRKELMKHYGGRCALCDTQLSTLLVASHIIPWAADTKNRLNPKNGILLCRLHDGLFETGFIEIGADLSIKFKKKLTEILVGKNLFNYLQNHTATSLRIDHKQFSPDPKFLDWKIKNTKE